MISVPNSEAKIRDNILARVFRDEDEYSFDTHYSALLLVKHGRAAEIVGNPFYLGENGCRQELPYTGLEGYYAGSLRTSKHPGLSQEEIVQELAVLAWRVVFWKVSSPCSVTFWKFFYPSRKEPILP
jgi:hypothetical protein